MLPFSSVRPSLDNTQQNWPSSLTQAGVWIAENSEKRSTKGARPRARLVCFVDTRSFFTNSQYEIDSDGNVEQEHDDLRGSWMAVNLENL